MTPTIINGCLIITFSAAETKAIAETISGEPRPTRKCRDCGVAIMGRNTRCRTCKERLKAERMRKYRAKDKIKTIQEKKGELRIKALDVANAPVQTGVCPVCGKPAMTGFKTCGAKMCRLVAAELIGDRMKEMLKTKQG